MDIKEREQNISEYFKMWISQDFYGLEEIFSKYTLRFIRLVFEFVYSDRFLETKYT
jgi:predicted small integral membrane protein